ncbi:MAG: ferritin-like domain-containing protein [Pseudomonadota bacterium]
MRAWFRNRYLDVLGSIYIYNEHRGYTAIDRVIEAIRARSPRDGIMLGEIEHHRSDERKHYTMFRRWFELQGHKPLALDRAFGHIDRFVEMVFGTSIDRLDTRSIVESDVLFERLCRVISLTERRGHRQIEILLANRFVRSDPVLVKIFEIIRKDEPSHWAPYEKWLSKHGARAPRISERIADSIVHAELLIVKLPILFLNPWARRRDDWPDAADTGNANDNAGAISSVVA